MPTLSEQAPHSERYLALEPALLESSLCPIVHDRLARCSMLRPQEQAIGGPLTGWNLAAFINLAVIFVSKIARDVAFRPLE
jgi:hypothetical protein